MPAKMYLINPELVRHSRHHTAYVGDGAISDNPQERRPIYKVTFIDGVARNVEGHIAQRLMDMGIAAESPAFTAGGNRLDDYYAGHNDVPIIGQQQPAAPMSPPPYEPPPVINGNPDQGGPDEV